MTIQELEPARLWHYFAEITQIPRPSTKEEAIVKYLLEFARTHSLEYKTDTAKNVVIYKAASLGYETHPITVLQCHTDMVCEKNSDKIHNFETDPIEAYVDGNWVKARGTTLGADDGIGIAAQLAVLESKSLKHGPIECLFTADEESGMTGAMGLSTDWLKGKILLNLDSEDDGQLFIGCAGGMETLAKFAIKPKPARHKHSYFRIQISGLRGGHSGDEIHKGHANAIKIL
ncbi:MAG: Cytosol non-specific dipeptidase, partial [Bacteroidota bacterium]